ncbi:hypothetical protein LTR56_003294 [Elasticomyces elasticus]|nr:hypothetical protein LTR56_003294 [Elasticomyces elasticus]KAK3664288.1 hypothetical protein LTR22_004986 [Elasticomyces elasticus]KAK4931504.1 hypothetical protein LTR49_002205 [Elasticomyces elasticus]KAK5765977.1 hypothetical protein LTS12_003723 [Elasticomyces elasticus]
MLRNRSCPLRPARLIYAIKKAVDTTNRLDAQETPIMQLLRCLAIAVTVGTSLAGSPRPHQPTPELVFEFPDPNIDLFYQAPGNIASYSNGEVVRNRAVATTLVGRSVESYQVFYRTTDAQGDAIGTVATILAPTNPSLPPKLFSYQAAEDALNLDCAPSWGWVNKSSALEYYYQSDAPVLAQWVLSQGYYFVSSDFEGPDAAWLVGLTEGRATLDGIRATVNHLHLPVSQTSIGLWGYSGGAHATAWAGSLAAAYAPELNIIGAAFGGTPTDLSLASTVLGGGVAALLSGAGLIGLANGLPDLNATLNTLLTPYGVEVVTQLRAPNMCVNANLATFADVNFTRMFTENPWTNPAIAKIVADESLLSNASSLPVPVPKFPRFQFHGTSDRTIPYTIEAQYVAQQCAGGADIRFLSLPDQDHGPAYLNSTLGSVACGANVTVPSIGSAEAGELLGVNSNVLMGALLAALTAGPA